MSRRKLFKCLGLSAWAILLLALLTPGGVSAQARKLVPMKVGTVPIANLLPFYAALHKGFFEEEGLKVEEVPMAGGAWIINAIAGGSVEIGLVNTTSHLLAYDQGFDIKMVAPPYRENCDPVPGSTLPYGGQNAILVGKDSAIRTAKDVEGKKVAVVGLKSIDWFMMSEWMKKNGADPEKIIWVESGFPQMPAMLASGQIDVAVVTEPFHTLIVGTGGRVLDYTFCSVRKGVTVAYFAASERWIRGHGDLVEKFVRAYNRAVDYVYAHPEERVDIVTKYTRARPELIRKMIWTNWTKRADLDDLQWWISLIQSYNLLKRKFHASDIVHKTAQ